MTVALSPSSSRYRVDIESPYATHPEKELPALRLNPAWQDELVKRSVGLQVLHAYRSDSLVREKAEKPWFQWQPDWSYLLDEYTYEHNYPGLVVDNSTQFFDYEGMQAQRIFYMPAYRTEAEKRSPVPDFRHTLLWRPDIRTAGESSISIPFTTSDLTGDFTITIEGLTQTGEALYATEQFQVK